MTVLPQCDRILVIDHGRITEMGSYDELVSKENGKFADFLQSYAKKIEQDNDDDRSGIYVYMYKLTLCVLGDPNLYLKFHAKI